MDDKEEEDALALRLTAAILRMACSVDFIDALPAPAAPPPSGGTSGTWSAAERVALRAADAARVAWDAAKAAGAATTPDGVARLFDVLADALEQAAWIIDVRTVASAASADDAALWTAVAAHAGMRLRRACAYLRAVGGPAAAYAAALAADLERLGAGR